MREVTGSTWTFQIIIIFMLIFFFFLTLVLNYSKAYTIKNRTLTVIEKYEGITNESGDIINNFASEHSYTTTGKCPTGEGWFGASDIYNEAKYEEVEENKNYYYCFQEEKANNEKGIYYNIIVFYKFNLPFLGTIATYQIKGTTQSFEGNTLRIKGA